MKTMGRAFGYSDVAVNGVSFPYPSSKLYISGNTGDIVYKNTNGLLQWFPAAQQYQSYDIAATQIVATGTVNGTPRSTSATGIVYCSSNIYS